MYLNIDGFNKINDRIQSQRQLELENQRRATQDARVAETFGRQQKQWGLDDALQTEVGAQAGELTGLASAKGYDWRQGIGVPAPTESNPAPGLAAPTNRAAIDQYTAPPADQVPLGLASAVKPGAQERPLGSTPMDDELETIKKQARIAQASRDPAMLAKAQAAFFDHKKRRTAMEMSDYFDSASPDELSRLASSITADKTNKVKAVYDKDSGFTRLETDDGVQTLRPAELKKYLISKALGSIDGMAAAQQSNIARTDKDNATVEKITATNNQGDYRAGLLDAKQAVIDAKQAARTAGQPNREERLRYTTLFTDASRNIAQTQKAISALQKEPGFTRKASTPGTPQAQQLQEMRDSIKAYTEERSLYQGLLAGSQTAPGLGSTLPSGTTPAPTGSAPGYQNEAAMRSTVAGDMGADPAAIQREIAQTTADLKKVTDPASRAQLQTHLADLIKQGQGIGLAGADPKPATGNRPPLSSFNR